MNHIDTLHKVGFYCGRFNDGFWGEPQNALTNIAFIIAALFSLNVWRRQGQGDKFQLGMIALAGSIGIGSFVFHTMPNQATLMVDLVPIQIFGLVCIYYIATRHFSARPAVAVSAVFGFAFLRQIWIFFAPRGGLGGGITHVPTLALLVTCGTLLWRKGDQAGKYLLIACMPYVASLIVRTLDLPLCSYFPFGLHWLWHILTASAAGIVLYGLIYEHNSSRDAIAMRSSA
jgi:hypothetical protein